jgi:hypothetical protein
MPPLWWIGRGGRKQSEWWWWWVALEQFLFLMALCAKSCYFPKIFGGGLPARARGEGFSRPLNQNGTRKARKALSFLLVTKQQTTAPPCAEAPEVHAQVSSPAFELALLTHDASCIATYTLVLVLVILQPWAEAVAVQCGRHSTSFSIFVWMALAAGKHHRTTTPRAMLALYPFAFASCVC